MRLHTSSLLRSGGLVGAALLSAMLSACGDSGSSAQSDAWKSFTQQKLNWQACNPEIMGENQSDVMELGERAKCALMRAPLDYANLALGELQVALVRVAAEQPQQRLGSIFFNPGGPGEDGLSSAPKYAAMWRKANSEEPTGKRLKDLSNSYDLIGFSPRGVGSSSRLIWPAPELLEVENDWTFDRSAKNLKNLQHNARLVAKVAAKSPLSQHINTVATARDMDLARELLGDAKLNYIGYSYGTWLGGWYASLFPERVGRMLLDSSMDIGSSFDAMFQMQEMGKQRFIDDVMLPYVVRHPERFNLGGSADRLREKLLALSPQLKAALFPILNFNRSSKITSNGHFMTAAIGLQDLRQKNPEASPGDLLAKIESYSFTPSIPDNQEAVTKASVLMRLYFRDYNGQPMDFNAYNSTHWSVRCNDTSTSGNEQYWIDVGNDSVSRYPFAGGSATFNPCLYWEFPVKTRPPLARAGQAAPILMLQSQYDALTPIEGARATLDALPKASMIVVENESQHALFPYGQACVDEKVIDYFLHGRMPARLSSCAGKPLPADVGTSSR